MGNKLTKEEIDKLRYEGFVDPVFFGKTFLPDWFSEEAPWVHRGLLAILTRKTDFLKKYGELDKIVNHFVWKDDFDDADSPEHPMFSIDEIGDIHLTVTDSNAFMLPRGFSKTTIFNAASIYGIVYQEFTFGLYISESGPHSKAQLNTIKNELETNSLIKEIFGELKPPRSGSLKWTDDLFETTTGIVMIARGRGGQVRGLNWKSKRPDWICVDDVEDEESVKTDEQRAKTKKWFNSAVKYARSRTSQPRMTILGTLLHDDALLMDQMRSPAWTSVRFAAIDKDGEALWPLIWSLDAIAAEKIDAQRQGQLASFYMELMSQLRNDDTSKFREKDIQHLQWGGELLCRGLVIDPAISEKSTADYCAFAVVSMWTGGKFQIDEVYAKKGMHPKDQVDKYFQLSIDWKVDHRFHGVESIAYQAALVHLLYEEMARRHHYFEIEKIGHGKQKKEERVEGILAPRYAAGYIAHAQKFALLETQLLDWPNGKKDLPDAVAMCIALLDPFAMAAADPTKDLADDQYDSLEEEFNNEDWRTAP